MKRWWVVPIISVKGCKECSPFEYHIQVFCILHAHLLEWFTGSFDSQVLAIVRVFNYTSAFPAYQIVCHYIFDSLLLLQSVFMPIYQNTVFYTATVLLIQPQHLNNLLVLMVWWQTQGWAQEHFTAGHEKQVSENTDVLGYVAVNWRESAQATPLYITTLKLNVSVCRGRLMHDFIAHKSCFSLTTNKKAALSTWARTTSALWFGYFLIHC